MKETTGCDTVILAFGAWQETPQSEDIEYSGHYIPTEEELEKIIGYAFEYGLKVIMKPMVNCRNGVWRAHINFFDLEVVCEPKWSRWFAAYEKYILKYAEVAERTGCMMFVIGCELVQTERKEEYWRALTDRVRQVYHGLITYNTDKYQEGQVKWWDCVDVISSSGYYPRSDWEKNLERIHETVKKYNKPFFFAECGCMCVKGCQNVPNDWSFKGETDQMVQADYFEHMFREIADHPWVQGTGIWDWDSDFRERLPDEKGYSVYGKKAAEIIRKYYAGNGVFS